jgi:ketol-acid reductoisomerase
MDQSEFCKWNKSFSRKKCCVGCGAQGLNQGLNMRDSRLDIFTCAQMQFLTKELLSKNASDNGLKWNV